MEMIDDLLAGAVDMHVHATMVDGYRWDLVELANKAIEAKMAGIVLKSVYGSSAERAYFANRMAGQDIFLGSIVLDRWTGGLNPAMVKDFVNIGTGIKVVFMPIVHAFNHLARSVDGSVDEAVTLFDGDKLVPQLEEVLDVIARNDLVLATGHISPEESLRLIDAARSRGVSRILVTHASAMPVTASVEQQKEMVRKGALIEHCMGGGMPFHSIKMKQRFGIDVNYNTERILCDMIEVGIEHCVASTDFGQKYNPLSVEGMRLFIRALLDKKVSPEKIKTVVEDNPKKLLGMKRG